MLLTSLSLFCRSFRVLAPLTGFGKLFHAKIARKMSVLTKGRNFREFAKVYSREIFDFLAFAKVNSRKKSQCSARKSLFSRKKPFSSFLLHGFPGSSSRIFTDLLHGFPGSSSRIFTDLLHGFPGLQGSVSKYLELFSS